MSPAKGRRPALYLWITDREHTSSKTLAGAAWANEFADGRVSYTLKLNPGITITPHTVATCFITLKPPMTDDERRKWRASRGGPAPEPEGDDDVPIA